MNLSDRFNQNYYFARLNNRIRKSDWYWKLRCKKISRGSSIKFVEKWADCDNVSRELSEARLPVIPYRIDIREFHEFIEKAGYRTHPYYDFGRHPNAMEKYLEHYVSVDLLGFNSDDVYIDIASCTSPMPKIISRLYGSRAFYQDLSYPDGINGEVIGGDAGRMPLPNNFASKMTLHCSFEHFEGEADIRFIKESLRVLKPGGRMCIVPLYMHHIYAIQTDPLSFTGKFEFEEDASIYCARGWGERHGRYYDVQHLMIRIVKNMGGLSLKIFSVENTKDVHLSCYLKYIALFEKNNCQ